VKDDTLNLPVIVTILDHSLAEALFINYWVRSLQSILFNKVVSLSLLISAKNNLRGIEDLPTEITEALSKMKATL
jgi:hypothetical protein